MQPHLNDRSTCIYAAQVCFSVLSAGGVAYVLEGADVARANVLRAATAFVAVCGTTIALLLMTGSSLPAIAHSLGVASTKLHGLMYGPFAAPHCLLSGTCAVAAAAAFVLVRGRFPILTLIVGLLKFLLGFVGAVVIVTQYNRYGEALGYLLPWTWLMLVPCRSSVPASGFARTFIALQAVWQGLQAYPVAGTQAVIATFLQILVFPDLLP